MKVYLTIALLFLNYFGKAQFNIVEHFNNAVATGYSMVVDNTGIHVVGPTYPYIDSNNIALMGYLATYDNYGILQYYDLVGDTLRSYEAEKLLIDSGGNKYIIGDFRFDSSGIKTNQGVFIQKRNLNNTILWTVEYQDSIKSVDYLIDDAVLLGNDKIAINGGYVKGPDSISGSDVDVLFIVIDTNGLLLTVKNIGIPTIQEGSYCITTINDSTIIIGGRKLNGANDKNWVIKMDVQGTILDEYISTSNRRIGVWDIVKTQDGGLACASGVNEPNFNKTKSYVEKLDSNLVHVWGYVLDSTFRSGNLSTSIAETSNGNIMVGGTINDFIIEPDTSGLYGYLLKLSASGDSIWFKAQYFYSNINLKERHNIYDLQVYNKRIYFVGDANDLNNPVPPGQSMWLVSTDSNGVISNLQKGFAEEIQILVFPNPTKDLLNIQFDNSLGEASFKLYDLQGRLQIARILKEGQSTLSLENLAQGLYIYEIQKGEQVKRGKVVKE